MRDRVVSMPERGWYSLTVREETARRVREQARARGLTVDELINELMTSTLKSVWVTCSLCGSRIKAGVRARFASGLLGNLLSLLLGPLVVSVGASGAIFGLFGACTAYLESSFGRPIIAALIYGLYLLLLNVGAGVNISAHFGGLLAGILMGYILSKRRKPEWHRLMNAHRLEWCF